MRHKAKLTMARRMMSRKDIEAKRSPFTTTNWVTRLGHISIAVIKRELNAKEASRLRDYAKGVTNDN